MEIINVMKHAHEIARNVMKSSASDLRKDGITCYRDALRYGLIIAHKANKALVQCLNSNAPKTIDLFGEKLATKITTSKVNPRLINLGKEAPEGSRLRMTGEHDGFAILCPDVDFNSVAKRYTFNAQ